MAEEVREGTKVIKWEEGICKNQGREEVCGNHEASPLTFERWEQLPECLQQILFWQIQS